jgi:L-threonylcarbamoyladenylate synthase
MTTELVAIDAQLPDAEAIARAAAVLRAGGLVAFPTETVYGLGANALDAAAVARVFAAKGRSPRNPLIVHVAEVADVLRVAAAWTEIAARLAERFWPGPLTMVLPRHADLPNEVTGGGATVAVRLPAHPIARALVRAACVPVAAPSANPSTRISATTADHVLRHLGGRIELVLDGGPTPGGLESTVLDVMCSPAKCLRPGLVSIAAIEAVIGEISPPDSAATGRAAGDDDNALRSPGLLRRHYAPSVPLERVSGNARNRVQALLNKGLRVGWLSLIEAAANEIPGLTVEQMPTGPADYAARLYAALHAMEAAGVERIVVSLPPATEDWLAVHDRLRRAAIDDSAT